MSRNHYKGVPKQIVEVEARDEVDISAEHGDVYIVSCPPKTYGTGRSVCCWLRNDSNKTLVLAANFNSWNGGNSNHNRVVYCEKFFGMEEPTANFVQATILPPNDEITSYCWDGTGSEGMTTTASGYYIGTVMYDQGVTEELFHGTVILEPGQSSGCIMQAEETGVYTTMSVVYFRD